MKKTVLTLALGLVLVLSGSAIADVCAVDAVPAATLLVPYFAVDLANADGFTTFFSVNNASDAPVLAHVTLWTDYSIPTIDFDVYLTGYDVQTFNVRDIFAGILPQTAPSDAFSNRGDYSDPHIVFPGCSDGLPVGNIPGQLLDDLLIPAHTGQSVPFDGFDGDCAGSPTGDIAVGYITVDYVTQCSVDFPNTPGYFDNVAGFENVLWGDVFWVDPANNFAQGETLVHVEACNPSNESEDGCLNGTVNSPENYTFYGRYVNWLGTDAREPLGNIFATRYLAELPPFDGTNLVCWRDAKYDPSSFTCGSRPTGFPLAQQELVIFDEEENPQLVEQTNISPGIPGLDILVCPREAQLTAVGSSAIPVEFDFGWLFLNLNHTQTQAAGGAPPLTAQAYVAPLMSASGRFSVGFDAITLAHSCDALDIIIDELGTTVTSSAI